MRRLAAWLNLAWQFALHVLTRMWLRPFRRGRDLARFRREVEPEGYVPLTRHERMHFVPTMQCIHCGLCAIACEAIRSQPSSAWDEAWTFVGGATRSLDRAHVVAADLSECARDPNAQQVCPRDVPINSMSEIIRRMAAS